MVGAERWRDPDDDLPKDYEERRVENYAKLREPLDPQGFVDDMREELDQELSQLNDALGGQGLRWLKISERKTGAIQLTPLEAAPEPINLRRLKAAIRTRWGVVPLMDMPAETAMRTGCMRVLTPVGVQNHLDPQALFERLLLVIYAYGTGTRPIRWEIIANNYDLMMKYVTAIRLRTASTEALLRRFTSETTHPAYAAMLEVGRARRSIFLARYLRNRGLQRETESGLNVVENYNGVNDYIRFGKRGELASNRKQEQELGMLCLHILQSALGYINTLMIQDTLALPEWQEVLTGADRRGLTPVFHTHMTPNGEIQLNLDKRLALSAIALQVRRPGGNEGPARHAWSGAVDQPRDQLLGTHRARHGGELVTVLELNGGFGHLASLHDRRIRRGLDIPMSSARAARELAAEVYRSEPLILTDS